MKSQGMQSKKGQRTVWLLAAGLIFMASLIGFVRKGSSTEAWSVFILACTFFIFAFTVTENTRKN